MTNHTCKCKTCLLPVKTQHHVGKLLGYKKCCIDNYLVKDQTFNMTQRRIVDCLTFFIHSWRTHKFIANISSLDASLGNERLYFSNAED